MSCSVVVSSAFNGLNTPLSKLPLFALHFSVSSRLMEESAPLCSDTFQYIPSLKIFPESGPPLSPVSVSSVWSARPMYNDLENFLGISFSSASEQEVDFLFSGINSRQKNHIIPSPPISPLKPSSSSSKGIRELNNLYCSVNYNSSGKHPKPRSRGKASSPLCL